MIKKENIKISIVPDDNPHARPGDVLVRGNISLGYSIRIPKSQADGVKFDLIEHETINIVKQFQHVIYGDIVKELCKLDYSILSALQTVSASPILGMNSYDMLHASIDTLIKKLEWRD